MCILAWGRDLDWSSPIVVEEAQGVGELLELNLGESSLVHGHEDVGWQDTPLIGRSWSEIEIEWPVGGLITDFVLDESSVDDAAGWRVGEATLGILDKESLSDPLVDNNEGDLWLVFCVVVALSDCLLELLNLRSDHLVSHGLTHAISVDDEVGWEVAVVLLCEGMDGPHDSLSHVSGDNLLVLLLHDVLGVVLTQARVGGGHEADD